MKRPPVRPAPVSSSRAPARCSGVRSYRYADGRNESHPRLEGGPCGSRPTGTSSAKRSRVAIAPSARPPPDPPHAFLLASLGYDVVHAHRPRRRGLWTWAAPPCALERYPPTWTRLLEVEGRAPPISSGAIRATGIGPRRLFTRRTRSPTSCAGSRPAPAGPARGAGRVVTSAPRLRAALARARARAPSLGAAGRSSRRSSRPHSASRSTTSGLALVTGVFRPGWPRAARFAAGRRPRKARWPRSDAWRGSGLWEHAVETGRGADRGPKRNAGLRLAGRGVAPFSRGAGGERLALHGRRRPAPNRRRAPRQRRRSVRGGRWISSSWRCIRRAAPAERGAAGAQAWQEALCRGGTAGWSRHGSRLDAGARREQEYWASENRSRARLAAPHLAALAAHRGRGPAPRTYLGLVARWLPAGAPRRWRGWRHSGWAPAVKRDRRGALDLVDLGRVARLLSNKGEHAMQKFFTDEEARLPGHTAGPDRTRWGEDRGEGSGVQGPPGAPGEPRGVGWREIEVTRDDGRPSGDPPPWARGPASQRRNGGAGGAGEPDPLGDVRGGRSLWWGFTSRSSP